MTDLLEIKGGLNKELLYGLLTSHNNGSLQNLYGQSFERLVKQGRIILSLSFFQNMKPQQAYAK